MDPRNDVVDRRGRPRVQTVNTGPELTVQSDKAFGDINHILKKYKEVGILDGLRNADLVFKDVSEFTDLVDALGQVKVAEKEFLKLPSKVRRVFHNDVAEWLDAAHDPEKIDALVKAGIIKDPNAVGPGGTVGTVAGSSAGGAGGSPAGAPA